MNKVYDDWLIAKAKLTEYKKKELELRNKIVDSLITTEVSGNIKFSEGDYSITIGLALNKVLDESVLDTIKSDLTEEDLSCLKYKPGLIAKNLIDLSGNSLLFQAITTKPRQPTLKIDISDD